MAHYHLALCVLAPPLFLATAWTGLEHDGSHTHLALGLLTAILGVAAQTLLILFMIVTGRVLRAAMKSRPLGAELLAELNDFFARRGAYPTALLAAISIAAAAVLGHGRYVGVPALVHPVVGALALVLNLWALAEGQRVLRQNQALVDRAAAELDRLDAEGELPAAEDREAEWAFGPVARWLVFALTSWFPYLYWGLFEWRGDFGRASPVFLAGTALVSLLALANAWRLRRV